MKSCHQDLIGTPGAPGPDSQCMHVPRCPDAGAPDRLAAHVVSAHPEQGWSLLCNGCVLFDDNGGLLPDGTAVKPQQPSVLAEGTVRTA